MPIDLRSRNRQPELMDDPGIDATEHARALAGLRRINWFSQTATRVWRPIERIARERRLAPVRVLDLACGGGDLALDLMRIARRRGVGAIVHGADISPTAVDCANAKARGGGGDGDEFRALDALNDDLPTGYDVITCSLFLHHLEAEQAVELLRRAGQAARHAVLVDDLNRSRFGYALAWVGCRLLSRSPVVHYDGPVSVEGAFTRDEAQEIAEKAGLAGARATPRWPERFQVVWEKPA